MDPTPFDALIVISFGGPESHADVLPFLENVLRGRNVPRERMLEVAEHYYHFDGRSPIGAATRAMTAAIERELAQHGPPLRVYQGNRNWHPFLADTLRVMAADGVRRAAAFVTSAFGSYSGCRQYLEDIDRARAAVGASAPVVEKLRLFSDHPLFLEIMAERTGDAVRRLPAATVVFTAHSIPVAMAAASPYLAQLQASAQAVAARLGLRQWRMAYQSRSGPPRQPWLEPDILAVLRELQQQGAPGVVIVPIGFLSDHMEVLYDLDTEARQLCGELGLPMERVKTAGDHPRFAALVRDLVAERVAGHAPPPCAPDCCLVSSGGRP